MGERSGGGIFDRVYEPHAGCNPRNRYRRSCFAFFRPGWYWHSACQEETPTGKAAGSPSERRWGPRDGNESGDRDSLHSTTRERPGPRTFEFVLQIPPPWRSRYQRTMGQARRFANATNGQKFTLASERILSTIKCARFVATDDAKASYLSAWPIDHGTQPSCAPWIRCSE